MGAVAVVMLWFGYSLLYYGYDQITSGNNSWTSLVWPGKYANAPKDPGASSSSGGILGFVEQNPLFPLD